MYPLIYIVLGMLTLIVLFWPKKQKGKTIPGPRGIPVIGNLLEVNSGNMIEKSYDYANQFGDIVKINICGQNLIFLNSYEMITKAYCGDKYKSYLNDRPRSFLGEHFLFEKSVGSCIDGNGSLHSELRDIVSRRFHVYGNGLKTFEDRAMSEIINMVGKIEMYGKEDWEVVATVNHSISNLMSIVLSGEPLEEDDEDADIFDEFCVAFLLMYTPNINLVMTKFPFVRFLPGSYRQYYHRFSSARQRLLDKYYIKTKDKCTDGPIRGFVDSLVDEQQQAMKQGKTVFLTDEMIMSIIMEFVISAFIPIRTVLSTMFLCLLNHPGCQDKIQKEIDDFIGDRLPAFDDKSNCPFLEAVVMETFRLDPVGPFGVAHTSYHHIEFEGYDVPKNSIVLNNLWFINHDEKIWGDPWSFRPERFLDEFGQLLPQTHTLRKNLVPFGLGGRHCLGEKFVRSRLFLYTATLLQRWKLIPSRDRCGPCDPRTAQYIRKESIYHQPFYCHVQERKGK